MEIIQQIISEWKTADQSTRQQVLEFLRASSDRASEEIDAMAMPTRCDPRSEKT
jgi:hypothetical protein